MNEELEQLPDKYLLAESAYNVFRNSQNGTDAIGHPIPDFESTAYGQQPWLIVVLKAFDVLQDVNEYPWTKFAQDLYDAWAESLGQLSFDKLYPQTQFAWQAVARFITQVVANEGRGGPEAFESGWSGWAVTKAEELEQKTSGIH